MDTSNLFFIEIKTLGQAGEFTDWLRARSVVSCIDHVEFSEWMKEQDTFPFSIFLNGMTYEFKNEVCMLFFLVGFEAAMGLRFDD
jgi:hypothetical protein